MSRQPGRSLHGAATQTTVTVNSSVTVARLQVVAPSGSYLLRKRRRQLRPDVNRTLKWVFVEAANAVAVHHLRRPERQVSRLYRRLRRRKGHTKAIGGAVARHLAEATWHVWSRKKPYRDRIQGRAKRGLVMSPSRLGV